MKRGVNVLKDTDMNDAMHHNYCSAWKERRRPWSEIWVSRQTRPGSMTASWRPCVKTTDSCR